MHSIVITAIVYSHDRELTEQDRDLLLDKFIEIVEANKLLTIGHWDLKEEQEEE